MIGWLKGHIVDAQHPGKLVIDVNGVGYDVETSLNTFFLLESNQEAVILHIHTVVREDALLLYGFANQSERSLFRSLIKVNGIGPKLAIGILSSISPQDFIQCIHQENAVSLAKLPGIGKKTAERLIVEMKGNLKQWSEIQLPAIDMSDALTAKDEAAQALEALGYKRHEINRILNQLDLENNTCENIIRKALQLLVAN